ncbi:MAG: NADH-quinone oxidoreductase subunit L, partial [Fimbriimonadaceae bacterium]
MEGPYSGIWLVVGLPLLGFLIQALLGKKIIQALGQDFGKLVMGVLAVSPVVAAFGIAADITYRFAQSRSEYGEVLTLFNWVQLQSVNIPFEFRIDTLSMTMVLIVTGVGSLIHIYATAYMAEDKDFTRFFTYMNLFIAFMLVLVLGNNLALLFIGWEGVGLCSYLLIGFWYKEKANSLAANKAFIVNRIGDFGLTLGMFVFVVVLAGNQELFGITDARWLSYDVILQPEVLESFANTYPGLATLGALLLFVGAMGKSAQFPLYIWLPDAMAGPTPVSALIHAATMVTSGVYLLNRMAEFFLLSPIALAVVAAVGALTALLGAAIAFGQTDIKKVLAYSTVSQLGYMFIACGVGAFYAGLFHVLTHAFFKALLFMGAGAVIAAMAHNQDMRVYGNLRKYMPATYLTMGVAFLAIAGVPYLFSGFWSKEAILAPAVNDAKTPVLANLGDYTLTVGGAAGWIGFIVAFMTAAYMTRMMVLTFGTKEERWRDLTP